MSRANTTIILALSVTALLWIVAYQMQYQFNTEGDSLDKIQQETADMKKQNDELRIELLHKEAYTTISQEAQKEEFVSAPIIYLR